MLGPRTRRLQEEAARQEFRRGRFSTEGHRHTGLAIEVPLTMGTTLFSLLGGSGGRAIHNRINSLPASIRVTVRPTRPTRGAEPVLRSVSLSGIRTQMSAPHTSEQIDRAIAAFTKVGKELGVI